MVLRFDGTRSPCVGWGVEDWGCGVCDLSLDPDCGVPTALLTDNIAECLGGAAMMCGG
jgi:hypothetical protein